MKKNYDTLIAFSGGLDSTVLLKHFLDEGDRLRLLYINFGRRSFEREFAAARLIALKHSLPIDVVDFKGFQDLHRGYVFPSCLIAADADIKNEDEVCEVMAQFNSNDLKKAVQHSATGDRGSVSGFAVTLSIASYYMQTTGGVKLAVGLTKEQMKARPGLAEALLSYAKFINLLNAAPGDFELATPFATLSKSEIVSRGHQIAAEIQISWSCLYDDIKHCGRCVQCLSRKAAFVQAGVEDNTFYKR